MNRPRGLALTALLMVVLSTLGWSVIDWISYRSPRHTHAGLVVFVIVIVTMKICALICVWYYYQGHNLARIAVLLTSLWTVYNLRLLTHGNIAYGWIGIIAVQGLLGLFFLYWLNTPEIRMFFKRNKPTSVPGGLV